MSYLTIMLGAIVRTATSSTALLVLLVLGVQAIQAPDAEARTNRYCVGEYYGGFNRQCGQDLDPACNSGPACDAGFIEWSGEGFPYTIDCPNVSHTECVDNPIPFLPPICVTVNENIPDVVITSGCYDDAPTCNACGGNGQPPCPDVGLSCVGCDNGTSLDSTTGLCLAPGTVGALCDISIGCADGLLCDPDASQCFSESQAGESCLALPCADGLRCTLAFECAHEPAGLLGETCDFTAPCESGLFCKPGFPSRCEAQSRPGESCNPLLPNACVDGSFCFAGTNGINECKIDPFAPEITAEQCRTFYSPRVASPPATFNDVLVGNKTRTMGGGYGTVVGIDGESEQHGVAYGAFGEYGCFNSVCEGFEIDVSADAFISSGLYFQYDDVGGESSALVASGEIGPASVALTTAFNPDGDVIGTEISTGIAIGINPIPINPGAYVCNTELITIYGDNGVDVTPITPLPGPAEPPPTRFGAVSFDGQDDRLLVSSASDQALLQVDDAFTLELWARASAPNQTAVLLDKPGEYRIAVDNGELTFAAGHSAQGWNTPQSTGVNLLSEMRWTHVALTYSSTDANPMFKLYINGRLTQSVAATGLIGDELPGDNALAIGNSTNGLLPFAGNINGVRVWSVERTRAELAEGLDRTIDPSSTGLLASWPLNDASGDALVDRGPQNIALPYNATTTEPVRVNDGRRVLGGAALFDGVNDHVAIDDSAVLDSLVMTNALTLEAWVHPTGNWTSSGVIAGKEGEYYIARNANGNLFYALANSSPGWVSVTTPINLASDVWTHVALTYSPAQSVVNVYVNGELAHSDFATGVIGDNHPDLPQFRIGGRQRDDSPSNQPLVFQGLIDEVRVWRRVREDFEIAATYNVPIDVTVEDELAGWWRFDEGAVNVAVDSSGNGAHGLFGLGSPWRYAQRIDAGAYATYPRSLIQGACAGNECAVDTDNDLVSDYLDNCLLHPNPEQIDFDSDGYGNACDPDFDGSLTVNFVDYVQLTNAFLTADASADLNGDGVVNFLDVFVFQEFFLKAPGPSALR